ncbi:MAG: hypothetical protein R3236_07555 [Phycisphaeraceae bacterium]|nr:hypothetical protein [Phycisphaeraceae bacterium]
MALAAPTARAEDYFLTIGGGYSPSGNQVSLEKNILYFTSLLDENKLSNRPHHIIFADGPKPGRTVQFTDPSDPVPPINKLLGMLVGSTKGLDHRYRKHRIPDVKGPSSVQSIDRWFETTGSKLQSGDRLVIYFTGHGGKASNKKSQDTKIYLWNRKSMPMTDFVKRLDKLDPSVQVVAVMVQCYSGGFANLIFKEGDPKKGMAAHNRVGFYATVHDRVAAGCTPDINEANYQEYSTHFWAGLFGKTRLGQVVRDSDYNQDGRVGYNEAHAYALIHSDTIDISIKTSGAFLRRYASTKKDSKHPDRLSSESDYTTLLAKATPAERTTLEALSKQ